jgi:ankyrin repeat protein
MTSKFFVVCALSLGIVWSHTSHAMEQQGEILLGRVDDTLFQMDSIDSYNDEPKLDMTVVFKNAIKSSETLQIHLKSYDVNSFDRTGSTLLHHAVSQGRFDIVKELVNTYRADRSILNSFKLNPFNLAIFWFQLTQQDCFKQIMTFLNPSIQSIPSIPFYND